MGASVAPARAAPSRPRPILPVRIFGIEMEGSAARASGGRAGLERAFRNGGLRVGRDGWVVKTDGSVAAPGPEWESLEINSPKLSGQNGINELHTAMSIWSQAGARVNRSAGMHVHIDAHGLSDNDLVRLAQVWTLIEPRYIWGLVSPSRRNGRWSRGLNVTDLETMISRGPRNYNLGRPGLNYSALGRHGSVEIRVHNGTANFQKVRSWLIFNQKLFDAVFHTAQTPREFANVPNFEGLLDRIGIVGPDQLMLDTRRYLLCRFGELSWEGNQGYQSAIGRIDPDNQIFSAVCATITPARPAAASAVRRSAARTIGLNALGAVNGTYTHQPRSQFSNPRLVCNHINNLASCVPAGGVSILHIQQGLTRNPMTFNFESRSVPGITHTVTRDGDLLRCSCMAYRQRMRCRHTINVAGFLLTEYGRRAA